MSGVQLYHQGRQRCGGGFRRRGRHRPMGWPRRGIGIAAIGLQQTQSRGRDRGGCAAPLRAEEGKPRYFQRLPQVQAGNAGLFLKDLQSWFVS